MKNPANISAAVLMAAILTLTPSLSGFCGITNWSLETAAATYTALSGTPLRYESTVSEEDLQTALFGWYEVPKGLRDAISEIGTVIYISDSASSDSNAVGCSGNYWKKTNSVYTIKLSYVVVRTQNDDISETVLHELGHVFDRAVTLLAKQDGTSASESEERIQIYNKNAENLIKIDLAASQNMYNCYEAFAETFRLYIEEPDLLMSASPEAFEFMRNLISKYAETRDTAA